MSNSGLAYDLTDSTANFNSRVVWSTQKVDSGSVVAQADTDEHAAAVWANQVDDYLQDANQVFNGAKIITALGIGSLVSAAHDDANEFVVGATGTANCGLTVLSSTLSVFAAGDAGSNVAGRWQYDHSGTPQWEIWAEGTEVAGFAAATVTLNVAANFGGDSTWNSADPTITVGNGSGTPFVDVNGGTSEKGFRLQQSGTTRGGLTMESALVRARSIGANGATVAGHDYGVMTTTSDATPTTIWSLTLGSNVVMAIDAMVAGFYWDNSNRCAYIRRALVYRDEGAAAALSAGGVVSEWTDETVGGMDCTIDVSGNDVRVRVTGVAGQNMTWAPNVRVTQVS